MDTIEKNNSGAENNSETGKTYTQEEVNVLLQKEGDRRVTEALKKAEKKNADKVKEAQRLAQMNEQEKYEYELEQREIAIREKEEALALAESKNTASQILNEKGLSLSLVDLVVANDAEKMKQNIDILNKAFKESVKLEVEKRLGSSNPKKSVENEGISKQAFQKMSVSEQAKLFRSNPELYKALATK